ncbi:dehydration-responsive element-binding protein 1E-like [Mercurialis annua]|uniref:dehydration-responsive element-binding protein 1E-like n=1 Tax=Mercurialis annua TaxID=3986 RepID=UPI0024AFAB7F|nr:dehydration-responsive element-binding protein 1E-like [Mercurialis annua]
MVASVCLIQILNISKTLYIFFTALQGKHELNSEPNLQADYIQSKSKSINPNLSSMQSDSSSGSPRSCSNSDEDHLFLASGNPKKRAGRRVFKETRHPVYRGVRRRNGNKWVCELRELNKKSRIWLGTYPTPEMAARAHDVAALALRGKSACLNFADSSWRLPVPKFTGSDEIRRVARVAAELFRPQEFGGNLNVDGEESNTSVDDYLRGNSNETVSFVDVEEVFEMPRLLAEMAEGLLLYPPSFEGVHTDWTQLDNDFDMSLWSY